MRIESFAKYFRRESLLIILLASIGMSSAHADATAPCNSGNDAVLSTSTECGRDSTTVTAADATAVGVNASATGDFSTALGSSTSAVEDGSTAVGSLASATGSLSTALGGNTSATEDGSTALGVNASAAGLESIALGIGAKANQPGSIALGADVVADIPNTLVTNVPILAKDVSGVVFARTMFEIQNPGNTKFNVTNTDASESWAFANPGTGFRLSRQGSGSVEFEVKNNGNAVLAGTLTENSDIHSKQDIEPLDHQVILEKVMDLDISQWRYKDDPQSKHIGPMAQDFYLAFELGDTDKGISSIDTGGVALAAIQALKQENETMKSENAQLRSELEAIKSHLGIQ